MDDSGLIKEQAVINETNQTRSATANHAPEGNISVSYSWNDIRAHALTLPEYEVEALRQIEFQLGHLPERQFTLPNEPFIRYALYQYDRIHKNFDKLCEDFEIHMENIRQKG